MADRKRRRPQNAAGDLFVDETCIDCDTCRWVAPETFDRADGMSRVFRQPGPAERKRALMALVACPTASIGCEGPLDELPAAQAAFPEPIHGPLLHCGWHSKASFGAASWLLRRPHGNVLIDSPRFARPLVEQLERLGGVHTMFLTHKDDVADHEQFARHFGARRVLHEADRGRGLESIEVIVEGQDEVPLADDLLLIPTPGHTAGSMCLLADQTYLFSGDHLAWSEKLGRISAFERFCWHDWKLQRASVERLAGYRFEWLLPGHGRRCRMHPDEMAAQIRACARWMESTPAI